MNTIHPTDPTVTRWQLDPAASSVEFRVPHFWGLVNVKGHFDRLDGWLEIDPDGDRRLELTIDAASVDTRNRRRNKHLRSADFFDAHEHPDVRFRSIAVTDPGDGHLHIEGELTAAGNRVTLELDPAVRQAEDELQIDASTTLDQRRLGMTWSPLGMTRTPSTLIVHARLRRGS